MIKLSLLVAGLLLHLLASATDSSPSREPDKNGIALLQRVAMSASTLSYSGVFVYRRGDLEETSRIARAVADGRELERIEVLDGSAREVIRNGTEVKCFLPNENRLIIERQSNVRGFPALIASDLASLERHYLVRSGGPGRVAGTVCQTLVLEPRDAFRYAHHLWIEPNSGLLLKSGLVDQRGQTLESFVFTQVSIGAALSRQQLMPSPESLLGRVQRVHTSEVGAGELKWAITSLPAGFRVHKVMMRRMADAPNAQAVVHMVISDGLAPVSVFIEEIADSGAGPMQQQTGAMSSYARRIGAHRALVMGEVPPATVKLIGDAIERRKE